MVGQSYHAHRRFEKLADVRVLAAFGDAIGRAGLAESENGDGRALDDPSHAAPSVEEDGTTVTINHAPVFSLDITISGGRVPSFMSIFGEFHVPTDAFALYRTLPAVPEAVVEIERVVATDSLLTPYFWVSGVPPDEFESAAGNDPSTDHLTRLDEFEESTLFRAEWTDRVEALVYAYTDIGATILEASGQNEEWELGMRFRDRSTLDSFREYCHEGDIPFTLQRLYEITESRTSARYGLTPKQHEALTKAWDMGYFDEPREVTLERIADEFGISQQALSRRLRRGHHALIANTIQVTPPSE